MVSPAGEKVLGKVLGFIELVPDISITVEGHTSRPDRNDSSSIKASSVKDYLVSRSCINSDQIRIVSYQDQKPLIQNGVRVVGKENNRVVLVFEIPSSLLKSK